jgi:hypothetical protein
MRKRFVALGVAAGLTFAGGTVAAAAYAADNGARDMHEQMSESMPDGMGSMMGADGMASMASMHTPEMDAMHDEMLGAMPEELREACDAAHNAMTAAADGESSDAHASHHPEG